MEATSPFLSDAELLQLPGVARALRLDAHTLLLWFGDGSTSLATRAPGGELWVDRRDALGSTHRAGPIAATRAGAFARRGQADAAASAAPQHQVLARTAGTVSAVHVQAGALVQTGDVLVTLELMKMELHVNAPRACSILSVEVTPGQAVEKGALLLRLN